MEHRGFVAWVCSDGVPLAAHAVAANERTIRAWIATEPGKAFSVHWKDLHGGARVRGTVHVDGVRCCGAVSKGFRGEVVDRSSCMAGATTSRPLLFVAMPVTDDEDAAQGAGATGCIRVKLSKVVLVGANGARGYGGVARLLAPPPVHEREKKMDLQCASLGPEQLEVPHRIVETRPLDPTDPGPHVVFEFYYRSHAWLEAQGIVQPPKRERQEDTPEPKPSRKKSRILVDKNASEDVKSSQSEAPRTPKAGRVKTEAVLVLLCTPGKLIDLTDD